MRKRIAILLAAVLLCLSVFGCTDTQEKQAEEPIVHLYTAPNTIPEEVLAAFTAQTGIQVKCHTISNEDVALKKLGMGMEFDLIIAENSFMERAAQAGVLQKLDRARVEGCQQLLPEGTELLPADAREYILPYTRTCALLLHNVAYTQAPVLSYASLWSSHMRAKLSVLPDARLMSAVALKSQGLSANATGEKELQAAEQALSALKPNVYSMHAEVPGDEIAAGQSGLSVVWARDAQAAYAKNEALEILYPSEGAIVKMTCMGISTTSVYTEEAYRLIDYLLQPENSLKVSKHLGEESLHSGVAALADVEYEALFAVYMAAKYDAKIECLHYAAPQERYTKLWKALEKAKTEEKEG